MDGIMFQEASQTLIANFLVRRTTTRTISVLQSLGAGAATGRKDAMKRKTFCPHWWPVT